MSIRKVWKYPTTWRDPKAPKPEHKQKEDEIDKTNTKDLGQTANMDTGPDKLAKMDTGPDKDAKQQAMPDKEAAPQAMQTTLSVSVKRPAPPAPEGKQPQAKKQKTLPASSEHDALETNPESFADLPTEDLPITADTFWVDPMRTAQFRQTLPKIIQPDPTFKLRSSTRAICTKIMLSRFKEELWVFGRTAKKETLAVQVVFLPYFLLRMPYRPGDLLPYLEELDQFHPLFWDYRPMELISEYLDCPSGLPTQDDLSVFRDTFNLFLEKQPPPRAPKGSRPSVVGVSLEWHLPANGYQGEIERPMLKVRCQNNSTRMHLAKELQVGLYGQQLQPGLLPPAYTGGQPGSFGYEVYQHDKEMSVEAQFQAETKLASWVVFDVALGLPVQVVTDEKKRKSRNHVTYEVRCPGVSYIARSLDQSWDKDTIDILFYDIETICSDSRFGNPNPGRKEDMVASIAFKTSTMNSPGDFRQRPGWWMCLGETHSTVEEMLNDTFHLFVYYGFSLGYNNLKYDMPFLLAQALHYPGCQLNELSALKGDFLVSNKDLERTLEVDKKKGEELGINALRPLNIPGHFQIDLYCMVDHKELDSKGESQKLDSVAPQLLKKYARAGNNTKKKKFPYHFIRPVMLTPEKRHLLREYNEQDVALLPMICDAQNVFAYIVSMMKLTWLCTDYDQFVRANQMKMYSLLCHFALTGNWALSRNLIRLIGMLFHCQFGGGLVQKVQNPGIHKWVLTCDFAGLYPSIMIALVICYSTILTSLRYYRVALLRGHQFNQVRVLDDGLHVVAPTYVDTKRNLLANTLTDLTAERARKKEEMKQFAPGSAEYINRNSQQLSIKIVCNGAYGATGVKDENIDEFKGLMSGLKKRFKEEERQMTGLYVPPKRTNAFQVMFASAQSGFKSLKAKKSKKQPKAYLPCRILATSTTATGQQMITLVKEAAIRAGADVIYGDTDSVMIKFKNMVPPNLPYWSKERAMLDFIGSVLKRGHSFADDCTKRFKKPIKLEMENLKPNGAYIKRKMYAYVCTTGLSKETKTYEFEPKERGLFTVKGDRFPLIVNAGKEILDKIVVKCEPLDKVASGIFEVARRLKEKKVTIDELTIKKKLAATYQNRHAIAQACVADDIAAREPGRAPRPGSMVAWVHVQSPPGTPIAQTARDVTWVKSQPNAMNMVDLKYYWNNGMAKPLLSIMETIYGAEGRSIVLSAQALIERNEQLELSQ